MDQNDGPVEHPAAPDKVKRGWAITYADGFIYAVRGDNTKDF